MGYWVCPNCGEANLYKVKECSCGCLLSKYKEIEKFILSKDRPSKKKWYWTEKNIYNEISEQTGMSYDISKKLVGNIIHPIDFKYAPRTDNTIENSCISFAKKDNVARCPKCKSTSIAYDTKKLSIGRGVAGGLIGGATGGLVGEAVGITLGGLSSKKGYCVCMNCGKRWKI